MSSESYAVTVLKKELMRLTKKRGELENKKTPAEEYHALLTEVNSRIKSNKNNSDPEFLAFLKEAGEKEKKLIKEMAPNKRNDNSRYEKVVLINTRIMSLEMTISRERGWL